MKRNVLCHDYANIIKGDRVVAKALDGCGSLGSAHFGDGPHDGCVFLVARDVLRLDVSLFDVGNQVARNGGRVSLRKRAMSDTDSPFVNRS